MNNDSKNQTIQNNIANDIQRDVYGGEERTESLYRGGTASDRYEVQSGRSEGVYNPAMVVGDAETERDFEYAARGTFQNAHRRVISAGMKSLLTLVAFVLGIIGMVCVFSETDMSFISFVTLKATGLGLCFAAVALDQYAERYNEH